MIADHLSYDRVRLTGEARTKADVLRELTGLLARGSDAPSADVILEGLREREQVMSTGIGHGIAIPHARLEGAPELRLALVRYASGVEFKSLDGKPVHLAFGVIGPPQGTGVHVKLLARIARLVKEGPAVDELLAANSTEALFAVLERRDG